MGTEKENGLAAKPAHRAFLLRCSKILQIDHIEVIFRWLMRVSGARRVRPIARLLHPESGPKGDQGELVGEPGRSRRRGYQNGDFFRASACA